MNRGAVVLKNVVIFWEMLGKGYNGERTKHFCRKDIEVSLQIVHRFKVPFTNVIGPSPNQLKHPHIISDSLGTY